MLEENKNYFRKILHEFINRYPFNPALFPKAVEDEAAKSASDTPPAKVSAKAAKKTASKTPTKAPAS
jgi:hypothetical protein